MVNAELLSKQSSGAYLQVVFCQGIRGDMAGPASPIVKFVGDEIGPGRVLEVSCPADGVIVERGKVAIDWPC